MEIIESFYCPPAPASPFPVLVDRGKLVGLDAVEMDVDLARLFADPKWFASLLSSYCNDGSDPLLCLHTAKCFVAVYLCEASKGSLVDTIQSARLSVPSAASYAGAQQLFEALVQYATALELAAFSYVQAAKKGDVMQIARCMRHATHALYALHACLNTYLIFAGALPLVASSYVVLKPKFRIGASRQHSFFLGPDGQADPETVVFLPGDREFIRPFDEWVSGLLGALTSLGQGTAHSAMWDPNSGLNEHFRLGKHAPRRANGGRRRESKRLPSKSIRRDESHDDLTDESHDDLTDESSLDDQRYE